MALSHTLLHRKVYILPELKKEAAAANSRQVTPTLCPHGTLLKKRAEVVRMGAKRYFVLRKKNGKEVGVFSGRQPRQAALKVANRGITDIRLRERGTKKVHIYKGSRVKVPAPPNAPSWMGPKVWKPSVKKIGIEKLKKL